MGYSSKTESLHRLLSAVSSVTGITVEQLVSKNRVQDVSSARHMFCYLATKLIRVTLQEIGDFINRDHSTIVYSRKVAMALDSRYKDFSDALKEIERIYKNESLLKEYNA